MRIFLMVIRVILVSFLILYCESIIVCETKSQEELIGLLNSQSSKEIETGKKGLIKLGIEALPILEKYLKIGDASLRYEIVDILTENKTEKATELLSGVVVNKSENEDTIVIALQGLKERDAKLKSEILIALLNEKSRNIRWHALDLVKEDTKDIKLIDTLKEKLWTENDWQIKGNIATKLSRLKNLDPEIKVKYILKILKEQYRNPIVVEQGGEGGLKGPLTGSMYIYDLVNVGPSAIPFLKEELLKEKDKNIKEVITIILGLLKDKEVFQSLLDITLNSRDGYIRSEAVNALGEIGDKRAVSVLKKALKDNYLTKGGEGDLKFPPEYEYMKIYYPVRQSAFFALTKLGVKVVKEKYNEYKVIE